MKALHDWLGPKKDKGIRLAVMDMWHPFRTATIAHAPQAAILFDKFHVMWHLGEALDKVMKAEYARLSGKERKYIKGQKYFLFSHKENPTTEGRQSLNVLLAANKRLKPYENFAEMIEHNSDGIATYYRPENKVSRFVGGLDNKIRVFQLRAYDLPDEECPRLEVLTSMLSAIWRSCEFIHTIPRRPGQTKPCTRDEYGS